MCESERLGLHPKREKRSRNSDAIVKTGPYVETDFGFHSERLRESTGMSSLKTIYRQYELEKDIETTARKHIFTFQSHKKLSNFLLTLYRSSKRPAGLWKTGSCKDRNR